MVSSDFTISLRMTALPWEMDEGGDRRPHAKTARRGEKMRRRKSTEIRSWRDTGLFFRIICPVLGISEQSRLWAGPAREGRAATAARRNAGGSVRAGRNWSM